MAELQPIHARSAQQDCERRDIPGFPGYAVDTSGRVWSRWKTKAKDSGKGSQSYISDEFHELSYWDVSGRPRVNLYSGRKMYQRFVYRLVLETFVGPCPPGMVACHFPDRNTHNNSLNNLRWGTYVENEQDKAIHGTVARGEKSGAAELTEVEVLEIRRLCDSGSTRRSVAAMFSVCQSTINNIVHRKTWRHLA